MNRHPAAESNRRAKAGRWIRAIDRAIAIGGEQVDYATLVTELRGLTRKQWEGVIRIAKTLRIDDDLRIPNTSLPLILDEYRKRAAGGKPSAEYDWVDELETAS